MTDARCPDSPNVVVLVMDTTRAADTVPADPAVTPALSRLAAHGTEYTRAFSAAPWTLPSHASLFTGTYPTKHGAHGDRTRLDGALPTVAELFRSAGYETVGASNNVWIADQFGFARGFDTFHESHERTGPGRDADLLDRLIGDAGSLRPDASNGSLLGTVRRLVSGSRPSARDDGAARTVDRVREWLETRRRDAPFFLFVNCIEPHLEYRPPGDHARRFLPDGWSYEEAMELPQDPRAYDADRFELSAEEWSVLRNLYRAEISYLDEQLARLRAALEAAGEWEDTVLVVTSDHGENIGEHGLMGHQYCLYDTLLHVPLVVHGGPFDGEYSGSEAMVQSVDIAPTLLDVAGIEAPGARSGYQGRSFHPSADAAPRSRVFAEYAAPQPPVEKLEERFGDVPDRIYTFQRSLRAVRTTRYKYVRGSDGSEWLYDVVADPGETTDLVGEFPERAADLAATLDQWTSSFDGAGASETVSVDRATEQRLSELGYL